MNQNLSNDILPFEASITVVIVTYKRWYLLRPLLNSILRAQSCCSAKVEIVVCINGPDFETKNNLQFFIEAEKTNIQIISLEASTTPGEARNQACRNIKTKWIFFSDDDVILPENIFDNFIRLAEMNKNTVMWGGPNLTPEKSTLTQKKIGWLLQNFLVTGPVSKRYKLSGKNLDSGNEFNFSLCNMFVLYEYFNKVGFSKNLKTAEENELIYNFQEKNLIMKSSDLLYVWHERRNSIEIFLKQIKFYGFGRGQLFHLERVSKKFIFLFVSACFALILFALSAPLVFIAFSLLWYSLIIIGLYWNFGFDVKENFSLPIKIWSNYFKGIIIGYREALREEKTLRSV